MKSLGDKVLAKKVAIESKVPIIEDSQIDLKKFRMRAAKLRASNTQ
jgi:biotin carboxylase